MVGEADYRRQRTVECEAEPVTPSSPRLFQGGGEPELLQFRLQQVGDGQLNGLVSLEVISVAQQEPATALDDAALHRLLAQGIGLVDADAVDHFATEARRHVEQVIDDLGLRTVLPDLQVERRVHVHRHCLDAGAAIGATGLEERAHRRSAVAFADPQHAHAFGVHHHAGVAVPLVQCELVNHQTSGLTRVEAAVQLSQSSPVDLLDGVPVQARELRNIGDRQQGAQPLHPDPKPARHARACVQPAYRLDHPTAAVMTIHSPDRHLDPQASIEAVAIAHATPAAVAHQHARFTAGTT